MSRGNKKRKFRGEPLEYKSKNVNYGAVDYAIKVGKDFYSNRKKVLQADVNKYRGLFLGFVTDRKKRKESFIHREAVNYSLDLMK